MLSNTARRRHSSTHHSYASSKQSNIIRFFSSSLSILGASYIIFAYVAFPEIRSPNRKLLFILSVLDLFMAVAYVIPVASAESSLCRFQAVSIALFASASIAWSVCFCVH